MRTRLIDGDQRLAFLLAASTVLVVEAETQMRHATFLVIRTSSQAYSNSPHLQNFVKPLSYLKSLFARWKRL